MISFLISVSTIHIRVYKSENWAFGMGCSYSAGMTGQKRGNVALFPLAQSFGNVGFLLGEGLIYWM